MFKAVGLLLALSVVCLAVDISGNWEFAVETPAGSGNPSFVFKQEGEKLTGTYSGLLGKANIQGTVKGDKLEFHFDFSAGGQSGTVKYRGTIESATRMKGDVEQADLGKGTWTGTKK